MKFLIAVFLPASPFVAPSPFINFGDFCQPLRLLHPPLLLFWPKFASLPVYSALSFYLKLESSLLVRSSHRRCSVRRKHFLEISQNSQENSCARVSFWRKRLLKKRLWHRCFPVNFAKFPRTPFLQNTSGRLFLSKERREKINLNFMSSQFFVVLQKVFWRPYLF